MDGSEFVGHLWISHLAVRLRHLNFAAVEKRAIDVDRGLPAHAAHGTQHAHSLNYAELKYGCVRI